MPEEVQHDQNEQQLEAEVQSEDNDSEEMVASIEPEQEDGALPEGVSERTRQEFEKLKESNKRLKAELDAHQNGQPTPPSLLDTYLTAPQFQPPAETAQATQLTAPPQFQHVNQATAEAEARKLYDEQGYVDAQELERRLGVIEQAERRAAEAEAKAQRALERVARFEIDAQQKRLYEAYPELDPSNGSQFNPDAYELVKNKMLHQLVQTGQQDALKAADEMSRYFRKQKLTTQQVQTLEKRAQATSISQSGRASAAYASDFEELRKKSLTSDEAMDERIRRAGI